MLVATCLLACNADECEEALWCQEQRYDVAGSLGPLDPLSVRTRGVWILSAQGRTHGADIACLYDSPPAPVRGAAGRLQTQLALSQFGPVFGGPARRARIELWADDRDPYNAPPCDDEPACFQAASDGSGRFSVVLKRERSYGFRIYDGTEAPEDELLLPMLGRHWQPQISRETPSLPATLPGMSRGAAMDLAESANATYVTDTGILLGAVEDCQRRPMGGTVIRIAPLDGPPLRYGAGPDSPQLSYVSTGFAPTFGGQGLSTGADGSYVAFNLPPGKVQIEAWGRSDDGGPLLKLACTEGHVAPGSVTAITLRPYQDLDAASCR